MPEMTYREALQSALREEMQRDENVFVMGEDIGVFEGAYKVTAGLLAEFGERRVRDTPIAEDGFVGIAVGAAMAGLRPVVEIMTMNFAVLAMNQIVNHAAKIHYMFGGAVKVPIVIRGPGGGGFQLSAQHSQSLEVWFALIPGLKVVAPATPGDAKGMLKAAIRDDNPVVFFENLGLYNTRGDVPEGDYTVPIGRAEVRRSGKDVTLVGYSRSTAWAMEAARQLETTGVDAEVVDLRSLRPLDVPTIVNSVRKTNRAVVVEEDWPTYGIGAEVAASLQEAAFDYLDAPIRRVGGAEVPMPYSKVLEQAAIPKPADVVKVVRELLG